MPDLYRFQIDHHGRQHDLRLARHPSESLPWLLTRVLAWTLHHEEGLIFFRGVCQGDWPAIYAPDPQGRPRTWIDIGLPDPKKLRRGLSLAQRVIHYSFASPVSLAQRLARLDLDRIELWHLDPRFLAALAATLSGQQSCWRIHTDPGHIQVNDLCGPLRRLSPP